MTRIAACVARHKIRANYFKGRIMGIEWFTKAIEDTFKVILFGCIFFITGLVGMSIYVAISDDNAKVECYRKGAYPVKIDNDWRCVTSIDYKD